MQKSSPQLKLTKSDLSILVLTIIPFKIDSLYLKAAFQEKLKNEFDLIKFREHVFAAKDICLVNLL